MADKNSFYITTAIDYPSGLPHIGHAYEKIVADVLARWHRKKGRQVFFLTGVDEHGQKIEKYARNHACTPQQFVDTMVTHFQHLCRDLDISYDDFIRTSQPRHKEIVGRLFERVRTNGDIYKGHYEGFYCIDCETFYLERDLHAQACPVHGNPVEWVREEGYFFAMSRYQERLLTHIENNPDFIFPRTRRNEIINRLREGVRDLNISRGNFTWGIPLPNDPEQVIYVWFDALTNYLSGVGLEDSSRFQNFWPADVHMIGKDILWFHAVIWPSMLLAAGIELPRTVCAHGFINLSGEKISKSKGVMLDLPQLISDYGADALRYFLLREISFGEDGNFSETALIRRTNSDLANDLGNLVYRSLTMIEKYYNGEIPASAPDGQLPLLAQAAALGAAVDEAVGAYDFSRALIVIWDVIGSANKYIEESKPWVLCKEQRDGELRTVMAALARVIRCVADELEPFLPRTVEKIRRQFGSGRVEKGAPLFPRIEVDHAH